MTITPAQTDYVKCHKSVINKVSKVKLILSKGQEKAQREAFWELEKGKWYALQVEGVGRQGCAV